MTTTAKRSNVKSFYQADSTARKLSDMAHKAEDIIDNEFTEETAEPMAETKKKKSILPAIFVGLAVLTVVAVIVSFVIGAVAVLVPAVMAIVGFIAQAALFLLPVIGVVGLALLVVGGIAALAILGTIAVLVLLIII